MPFLGGPTASMAAASLLRKPQDDDTTYDPDMGAPPMSVDDFDKATAAAQLADAQAAVNEEASYPGAHTDPNAFYHSKVIVPSGNSVATPVPSPGPVPAAGFGTKPSATNPEDVARQAERELGGPPITPVREGVAGGLNGSSASGSDGSDSRIKGLVSMAQASGMSPTKLYAMLYPNGRAASNASLDNNGLLDPGLKNSIDSAHDASPSDLASELGYKGPALSDSGGYVAATQPAYLPESVYEKAMLTNAATVGAAKAKAMAADPLGLQKTLLPEIFKQAGEINKLQVAHDLSEQDQQKYSDLMDQANEMEALGLQKIKSKFPPATFAPPGPNDTQEVKANRRIYEESVAAFRNHVENKRQGIQSAFGGRNVRTTIREQGASPTS